MFSDSGQGQFGLFMKIVSWNVRGLGSRVKRRAVKDFLRKVNPDIVMIQETKKEVCERRFLNSFWSVRNKDWVVLPACGRSGGILIIWDLRKFRCEEVLTGSFSVTVKLVLEDNSYFWLTSVYGPNKPSLRDEFWQELMDIFGVSSPNWCVGGDFNVIRRSSEKLGGTSISSSMRKFDGFIRECELFDPHLGNAEFTWSNMQGNLVCKRLDRFLFSSGWEQCSSQSIQEVLPRITSDHWPIALDTNPFKWGPTPFRFENMWLLHHGFRSSFERWWTDFGGSGWEGHKFMQKLQCVKQKLKCWNRETFGAINQAKEDIIKDIEGIDKLEQGGLLSEEALGRRTEKRSELEKILLREEVFWRQKSNVLIS